jgi:protein-disulfide isomerase
MMRGVRRALRRARLGLRIAGLGLGLCAGLVGCKGGQGEADPTYEALPTAKDVDDSLADSIRGQRRAATYDAGKDGVRGAAEPLVTIVEFSDFQCPFCGQAAQVLDEALQVYPDDVRLVFKHFPLKMHPNAELGARAAVAAGRQGRFWAMHDRLFRDRTAMSEDDVRTHAEAIGLDVDKFEADLASPEVAAQVQADQALGRELGVRGTPALFINGVFVGGAPKPDMLRQLIERERTAAERLIKAGSGRDEIYARIMRRAGAASAP